MNITNKKTSIVKLASVLLLALCAAGTMGAMSGDWINMSGSFEGWQRVGTANWRIENGEFVADSGNGQLMTQRSFDNVRITMEFWAAEGSNSGVFLRITDPANIADSTAYEVNIFDTRPDQTYRTGGLVNFSAPSQVINTEGKWNTYDITVDGDHIVVMLNGTKTVDTRDATYTSGPLSLQFGQGVLRFRNVQIMEL